MSRYSRDLRNMVWSSAYIYGMQQPRRLPLAVGNSALITLKLTLSSAHLMPDRSSRRCETGRDGASDCVHTENNGKERQRRPRSTASLRAAQGAQAKGPPPVAAVESAVLRRYRHADRRRRHLVLPEDADRPAGPGETVRLGAQARRRQLLPRHAGRERSASRSKMRRSWRSRCERSEGRDGRVLNFRTNVDEWVACGAGHALRFEPEAGRRPQAVSARAPRSVGQGDARAVLRSGRARRGARGRRRRRCSASPRAANFSRWRGPAR